MQFNQSGSSEQLKIHLEEALAKSEERQIEPQSLV